MKETLEEAAKKYTYGGREGGHRTPFLEGVKWQQERSYSEEEVRELVTDYEYAKFNSSVPLYFTQWFEKFKNK